MQPHQIKRSRAATKIYLLIILSVGFGYTFADLFLDQPGLESVNRVRVN